MRRDAAAQAEQIRARLRNLLEENLEGIGQGLVQKAVEGNYNAAQLLLRLSGIDTDPGAGGSAEDDQRQARIFFLEMVEQMLGERRDESTGKLAEEQDRSKTRL